MIEWKRNFVMVALSQFLSIMGFTFAMPFAPYYIQQLGITDPNELKMWIALFTAAAPLTLAVASPIWGTWVIGMADGSCCCGLISAACLWWL